ncbi:phosphoribosyl-AMP cyclohydrolase [Propionibacterium australiense]|nr:phosphoribosyl-AMP cyclohydrolase [Propionibacterium australiense]RLP11761.1 phosphoribosyl-AMP cyclohydrolase [Propionibacterium australiense]RLP12847.1 phosphoribosyl-AMP cyclohydrolase [Propionibacterium australiense]
MPSDAFDSPDVPELPAEIASRVRYDEAGLIPAIAQDATSGRVLMMAWMNATSLAMTLVTRRATYWSRSRSELWVKGATSGHTQYVRGAWLDCDGDTILLSVDQAGGACHTGERSCFDTGGPLPLAGDEPEEVRS